MDRLAPLYRAEKQRIKQLDKAKLIKYLEKRKISVDNRWHIELLREKALNICHQEYTPGDGTNKRYWINLIRSRRAQ